MYSFPPIFHFVYNAKASLTFEHVVFFSFGLLYPRALGVFWSDANASLTFKNVGGFSPRGHLYVAVSHSKYSSKKYNNGGDL